MTHLYTYLHVFKGPKKIIGIAGKLLKTMQIFNYYLKKIKDKIIANSKIIIHMTFWSSTNYRHLLD